ncbi:MAG: LemA family protein [Limisphaerales bacterium]
MNNFAPWLPVIGCVLGLLCLLGALRAGKRRRLVDNLPTSKTTGVFIGLVELKGTAEIDSPLKSFLAECRCVHYSWGVEEEWERTVTETYTDSDGKTKTRTRTERGWTTVASGGEMIPFYLNDDCGSVLVRPEGAEIEALSVFDETCTSWDALYYGKGPAGGIMNSTGRRHFHEHAIPSHTPIYVMGQSREREDVVAPEIAADKTAPMFLISTRSEQQISSGFAWAFWGWLIFGLLLAVGGFVWRDGAEGRDLQQRWPVYLLPAFGFGFMVALGWVWMVFNSLIDLRQRVRQGWAQVDVQLKRRFDLIPTLVATVTGLRDHEAKLQESIALLRAQQAATPPGVAGPDYAACTKVLVAVREAYPELTTGQAFLGLQKSLVDTEHRIALARGYFNEIATHYNTRLEVIPERFVAALGGLKLQPLMLANDFEREAVTVNFAP